MRITLVIILLLALTSAAYAYKPHVGDRAANIYGRDALTDTVVHLDDYAGSWVFIDFWATWCGPCVRELPNMLEKTAPWREKGLELFSISLDNERTDLRIAEMVKEYGIDYPVIFDGNGWDTVQSREWGINSIPATFLLDPQGNIVATNLRGESLGPALDFFLGNGDIYVPIGVRSSNVVNDDGSVDVMLELSNPRHTPLNVKVDYWHTRYIWADDDPDHENRPINREYIEENEDGPEMEMSVDFGEFGDAVTSFTIPFAAGTHRLNYYVMVQLPGSEELLDGEGLWVTERGGASFED